MFMLDCYLKFQATVAKVITEYTYYAVMCQSVMSWAVNGSSFSHLPWSWEKIIEFLRHHITAINFPVWLQKDK